MTKFSRQNNFDLIRLLAALQVALLHGYGHLSLAGKVPWFDFVVNYFLIYFPGVPIFFAMSGFLIFHSYERNRDLRRYSRNRFLRLFPGLWVSFLTTFVALVYFGFIDSRNIFSTQILSWIGGQVTFFQFYTPELLRGYALGNPNGSLWTIAVEIQYYIFVPVIFLLIAKLKVNRSRLLVVLAILSILLNYLIKSQLSVETVAYKIAAVSLFPYLFYFLIGALIYLNFEKLSRLLENRAILAFVCYVVLYLIFSKSLGLYKPSYWPDFTGLLLTVPMIWATFALAFSKKDFSQRLLRGVDLSYGLYIYHMIVLSFIIESGAFEYNYSTYIIFIIASFAFGFVSWKLIEARALRLKTKKTSQ